MRLPRWLGGRARTSPPADRAARPPERPVPPGYRTDRGEMVRSQAEAAIANLLHRARLDYAYRGVVTGGAAWGAQAPAFSVPGPNGAVLWEHLARDDHPGDWAARRAWYHDNGFIEGQRLFVSRDRGSGGDGEQERRALQRIAETIRAAVAQGSVHGSARTGRAPAAPLDQGVVAARQAGIGVPPAASRGRAGRPDAPPIPPGERLVVLDFETTGLSAARGARVIEVGAVEILGGRLGRTWQSLANPGVPVPSAITQLTGITPAMLRGAPPAAQVMDGLRRFIGRDPVVAHNAGFDGPFLAAEMAAIGHGCSPTELLCTLKLARRVYRGLPGYGLGVLIVQLGLEAEAEAHRALPDAIMAARLLLRIRQDLSSRHALGAVPTDLLRALQACPPRAAEQWLRDNTARP